MANVLPRTTFPAARSIADRSGSIARFACTFAVRKSQAMRMIPKTRPTPPPTAAPLHPSRSKAPATAPTIAGSSTTAAGRAPRNRPGIVSDRRSSSRSSASSSASATTSADSSPEAGDESSASSGSVFKTDRSRLAARSCSTSPRIALSRASTSEYRAWERSRSVFASLRPASQIVPTSQRWSF